MRTLSRLVMGLLVLLSGAPAARGQEVTLSVAISMKDAVEEVGRSFMRARPGVVLRYNFGSSGELQRQIEAGAPVDLFISAAERQMDDLERKGLIRPGTPRVFARNVLTVIVPADSALPIAAPGALLDRRVRRIVIGDPKTVPVGQYSEESLRALGVWERLSDKLVYAENVRQALEYVARGEVEAGFVYTTDAALRRGRVREAFRPDPRTYHPVVYPAAVLRDAAHPALAAAFLDRLLSREGQTVLARFGFEPPPAGAIR